MMMITQQHARRIMARLTDYDFWEKRAHRFIGYLADIIGEEATDAWLDETFPDGTETTWQVVATAVEVKLAKLHELIAAAAKVDAADQRRTLEDARYSGAW